MAHSPVVLIIGCGIAGPVLAIFLKQKGYHPIVFEKVRQLGDAGASLMLMPNGMKVLNIVGIADEIISTTRPLEKYEDFDATGVTIGGSDLPRLFVEKYSQQGAGCKRTTLNLMLKDALRSNGIECREGWALEGLTEEDDGITAHFNEGRTVAGAFVVGCDGIKGKSREVILSKQGVGEEMPLYTGLSQTAGISPTPLELQSTASMNNWYGNGIHVISYPISPAQTSWAVTLRETEQGKETWRLFDDGERAAMSAELAILLQGFPPVILDLVNSVERLTKYGLFDRAQLDPHLWHWSRCVLVGDAAHPTSPHLGQGANQALEDCYHLSRALPDVKNVKFDLSKEALSQIFTVYAEKRQARTAQLVKGARAQGDLRVFTGSTEEVIARDASIATGWKDKEALAAKFDNLCKEPSQEDGYDHTAKPPVALGNK